MKKYNNIKNLFYMVFTIIFLLMVQAGAALGVTPNYIQRFSSKPPNDGSPWSYYSTGKGRIEVPNGRLRMDMMDTSNSAYALNEATLTIDLAGKENVVLRFLQEAFGDERDSLSSSFSDHANGDGVSISMNGTKWYTIVNADKLGVTGTKVFSIDLDAEVKRIRNNSSFNDSNFGYTSNFKIKFQQYDDYAYATDGREWDDISVLILKQNQIAGGYHHSLYLNPDGTVSAWGQNQYRKLGDGTTIDRTTPVTVLTDSGDPLSNVVAISAGGWHTLALNSDGTVWAWGNNGSGQAGIGMATQSTTPIKSGISNVVAIVAVGDRSLALKADGTVWAWGYNRYAEIDDTFEDKYTPVQVSGLSDVVAIASGYLHSLALKADGTVWAWGNNEHRQLGDRTTDRQSKPVQVSGLSGVVAIAAGEYHSLALNSDGTVSAWGSNSSGELGDGTTYTQSSKPVQVSGLSDVVAIAGGSHHSRALKADGTVWTWGYNYLGNWETGRLIDNLSRFKSQIFQVWWQSPEEAFTLLR